jgi:hypothetical protein
MPSVKKVSYWAFQAASPAISGFGRDTEMFGELCRLQTHSFFSIGHSFAALAFVVSAPVNPLSAETGVENALRMTAARRCSSNQLVRTA